MRAFQCSKCTNLDSDGIGEKCFCLAGVCNPAPGARDKNDLAICKQEYKPLDGKDQWHEPFYWEKKKDGASNDVL